MVLLMITTWRGYYRLVHPIARFLLVTLFVLFWINFIHCALTLSFYHKYFIYPLSVIICILLILLEKAGLNKPLQSLDWFRGFTNFLVAKMPILSRWLTRA